MHLYLRLKGYIILVRGHSKHMYFPAMKIDPKYAFFPFIFGHFFCKNCDHDQKHSTFFQFCMFSPLHDVRCMYSTWVLERTLVTWFFFQTSNASACPHPQSPLAFLHARLPLEQVFHVCQCQYKICGSFCTIYSSLPVYSSTGSETAPNHALPTITREGGRGTDLEKVYGYVPWSWPPFFRPVGAP